jgi:very-short-patch-repair endonuclease
MKRSTAILASPKKLSNGEETFALHCRVEKVTPEREYKFHPRRRWKFDFAFPESRVAVEIEGGIWNSGRHTRGSGFEGDCVKYNTAVKMGWVVLRYSPEMVMRGNAIDDVLEVLAQKEHHQ